MDRREFIGAAGSGVAAAVVGDTALAQPDDPIEVVAELLEEDVVLKFLRHRVSALVGRERNDPLVRFVVSLEAGADGLLYALYINELFGKNGRSTYSNLFCGRELLTVTPVDLESYNPRARR